MQGQFLSGEDPLEEEMATHSSILLVSYKVYRVTKSTTPQKLKVDESLAGARGGRDREYYLMATGFPSEVMRKFWMQTVLMVA